VRECERAVAASSQSCSKVGGGDVLRLAKVEGEGAEPGKGANTLKGVAGIRGGGERSMQRVTTAVREKADDGAVSIRSARKPRLQSGDEMGEGG
jgi:hypothetical protein